MPGWVGIVGFAAGELGGDCGEGDPLVEAVNVWMIVVGSESIW